MEKIKYSNDILSIKEDDNIITTLSKLGVIIVHYNEFDHNSYDCDEHHNDYGNSITFLNIRNERISLTEPSEFNSINKENTRVVIFDGYAYYFDKYFVYDLIYGRDISKYKIKLETHYDIKDLIYFDRNTYYLYEFFIRVTEEKFSADRIKYRYFNPIPYLLEIERMTSKYIIYTADYMHDKKIKLKLNINEEVKLYVE